ncbi:hypothetical protein CJ030_MR6G010814 [Morella rubra]|uniref:Uncharacterized protein n=1 Tax=Morella rubra TaxID=262757 RepID=A0A6A1VF99_9ROSI|nr:hypothetical protein CJ030_MR6G010814 [Morella rubra]
MARSKKTRNQPRRRMSAQGKQGTANNIIPTTKTHLFSTNKFNIMQLNPMAEEIIIEQLLALSHGSSIRIWLMR